MTAHQHDLPDHVDLDLGWVRDRTTVVRGREARAIVQRVAPVVGVLMVVFGIYDVVGHLEDGAAWRLVVDLIPAAVMLVLVLVLRRGLVSPWNAGWWVVAGSLSVSVAVLVTLLLARDLPSLAYLLVMSTVNGASALTVRQYSAAQSVPVLGSLLAILGPLDVVSRAQTGDWVAVVLVTLAGSLAVREARERGFRDMAQLLELLRQQSLEDPLTGLGTRRALEQSFPVVRGAAEEAGLRVFLVFVDVDGLKPVNDLLGHDRGDEVLLAVTEAIRDAARSRDVLVRWGGDEFAVLGMGDPGVSDRIATSIVQRVAARNPVPEHWAGVCSTGAVTAIAHGCELEALVTQADAAMYDARRSRRMPA